MKTRILGLAGMLSVTLLGMATLPAQAHDDAVFHGEDYARTYITHGYLGGCDREADGHAVRAHWRNASGDISVGPWDGTADAECGISELPSSAVQIRICENEVGCSRWENK